MSSTSPMRFIGVFDSSWVRSASFVTVWRNCTKWRSEDAGVRVTAGWDHDAARAAKAGQQHGVELCDSPGALLGREELSVRSKA